MKQGTNFHLLVEFDIDLDKVEKIEFAFSNKNAYRPIKTEIYPVTAKRVKGENRVLVPFTKDDTFRFTETFFMDTRITMLDTMDQPETPIIELHMSDTLFERERGGENDPS